MARAIASVALGFVIMVLIVAVSFFIAGTTLGDERIYQAGSFEPSLLWAALSITLSLIAAIAGGFAAASIARSPKPLRVLAGFVFALGVFAAIPSMRYDRSQMPPRTGEASDHQVAMQIPPPLWIALLNPFLGAAGVMIGAGLRGTPKQKVAIDESSTSPKR